MGNISLLNKMLIKTVEKWDAESIPFLMPKIQNKGEDYASKKIHSDPAAHRHCNRVVPGGVIFLFKKAESRLAQ